ncbi:Com family DNA-binding transcriptional regulator [Magnetococcus sp. PR-3]|uniref:Com family DNA-binding transcriptional regulator n=1 Tax=Magnetococcus sp. PR-3 TaxID=3120355 RepID=UPI003FA59699
MQKIRCSCGKLLCKAEYSGTVEIKCPRCGTLTRAIQSPQPERHERLPLGGRDHGNVGSIV